MVQAAAQSVASGSFRRLPGLAAAGLLFALAGCGNIDWFPKYVRAPTTPDPFSFTGQSGVGIGVTVKSNAITVSGLTGATSPVSITGPTGSKYAINDAAAANATAAAGTVKNGDTVIVVLPTAATPGTSTTATLTLTNNSSISSVAVWYLKLLGGDAPVAP